MSRGQGKVVVSPLLAQRRRAVRAARRRRIARRVVVLLAVACLSGGGVALSRSSVFGISRIDVAGAAALRQADVVAASGLRPGARVMGMDLETAAARVRRLPGVRSARVVRSGALGVRIEVEEKAPAFEARAAGARWFLDQDGAYLSPWKKGLRLPVVLMPAPDGAPEPRSLAPADAAGLRAVWDALPGKWKRKVAWFEDPAPDGSIVFALDQARVVFGPAVAVDQKLRTLGLLRAEARRRGDRLRFADVRSPERPAARIA